MKEHSTYNKGHGREEWRHIKVVPAPNALKKSWAGLVQIGCITRRRKNTKTGQESLETAYFITSLSNSPAILLKLNRDHWKIENNLHRNKDTILKEDAATFRKSNAPHNMATCRAAAITFLKNYSSNLTEKIECFQRYPKRLLKLLADN